jgi:hypothetical protein
MTSLLLFTLLDMGLPFHFFRTISLIEEVQQRSGADGPNNERWVGENSKLVFKTLFGLLAQQGQKNSIRRGSKGSFIR